MKTGVKTGMIGAKLRGGSALASRLEDKAQITALAYGQDILRRRKQDAGRWRDPSLLWPLFAGGA